VNMKTIVNEKAIQTREYKNYLFSELLKCAPLQKDQSVRIKVVESETPFPKITQGLDNFSDRGFVSGEIITPENRIFERRLALVNYTHEVLSKICTPLTPPEEPKNEKDVAFWFAVVDPEKIYAKAKKSNTSISSGANLPKEKSVSTLKFFDNPPRITFGKNTIDIPANSLQFCTCKVAFSKEIGEIIHWDEVAEEIDGKKKDNLETTWRSVYDALRQINKKVVSKTGKPLFKVSKLSFYRLA